MLPLPTRLWFAWVCFFRVVFDGAFASVAWAAWAARDAGAAPELPAAPLALPPTAASTVVPEPVRALQLLSLLQREGRLVDFLQQDITTFPDADVGAAAGLGGGRTATSITPTAGGGGDALEREGDGTRHASASTIA